MLYTLPMEASTNSQQNPTDEELQASYSTPARTPRGIKRPPARLKEIIRLVNLVSPERELKKDALSVADPFNDEGNQLSPDEKLRMEDQAVLTAISNLEAEGDEGLKEYLLELMVRSMAFYAQPKSKVVAADEVPAWPPLRYQQICYWRDVLRMIARRKRSIELRTTSKLDFDTGTLTELKDDLTLALDETDFRNIRECVICGRIHFAGRLFYKGKEIEPRCGDECGKKIRDRRYEPRREKYELNRALKDATKDRTQTKKRAKTVRER